MTPTLHFRAEAGDLGGQGVNLLGLLFDELAKRAQFFLNGPSGRSALLSLG